MKNTITYCPTIPPEKLAQIIHKLNYSKLNRFIDDAVREKIARETNGPRSLRTEAMLWEVMEVRDKYKSIKLLKPIPELAKEIDKKANGIISRKFMGYRYKGSLRDFVKVRGVGKVK